MTTQSQIEKRAKILEAALQLFVEQGFHATPTSAITKRAGVSAGILFHYFNTKEELIYTLFLETKLDFYSAMIAGIEKIKSPESRFRLIWSNMWNYGLDHPHHFRFVQQIHNSPFIERIHEDPEVQQKNNQLAEMVKDSIATGLLKNIPIELHISNIYHMTLGLVELIKSNPDLRNDNAFIEQAWECFWDCAKA